MKHIALVSGVMTLGQLVSGGDCPVDITCALCMKITIFVYIFHRPDYTKLGVLRQRYPSVKIMALTATATPVVRADILKHLGMNNSKWFLCSFNRPNLKYEVRTKKGKASSYADLIELLRSRDLLGLSGIVYCFSRRDCDTTAQELKQAGLSVR